MQRLEKIRVKRQCAHCLTTLGYVYWDPKPEFDGEIVTHGICPECQKKVIAEAVKYQEMKNPSAGLYI